MSALKHARHMRELHRLRQMRPKQPFNTVRAHLLLLRPKPDASLLAGHVRECRQWSLDTDTHEYRWDFAYTDPASGRFQQYSVIGSVVPGTLTESEFAERIREPSVACLARLLHRKCGVARAIQHEHRLPLPRVAEHARYV